jgi:hypothetical protein
MVELSHWKDIVVPQRYDTGCIPTGYEWMIRYLGIEGVNLGTFQDDFDLTRRNEGDNSFVPIADKIKEKYPQVNIKISDFRSGADKIAFLKRLIEGDIPSIMSIALSNQGRWHIVPVVSVDDTRVKVIWGANAKSNRVCEYSVPEIAFRHDNWAGGKDISWIER